MKNTIRRIYLYGWRGERLFEISVAINQTTSKVMS